MKIILGSTSELKIAAVQGACEMLDIDTDVRGVPAGSGVNPQPWGIEEIHTGAMARALIARSEHDCDLAIGIESGILRFGLSPGTLDIAVIVLITKDNKVIVTSSNGIQFPEKCVDEAFSRGFDIVTVGSVIAERYGGDPTDPHLTLTNGKISRRTILTDALITALEQWEGAK